MQTFTTAELRERLKGTGEGRTEGEKVRAAADAIQFLEFSDLEKSVKAEVEFVKAHPLIVRETEVTGWVYHVESGKVCVVSRVDGFGQGLFLTTGPSGGLTFEPDRLNHQMGADDDSSLRERDENIYIRLAFHQRLADR